MGESVERYEVPEGFELTEREMVLGASVPAEMTGTGLAAKLGIHWRSKRIRRVERFTEDVAEKVELTPNDLLLELEAGDGAKSALFDRALEDSAEIGDDDHRKRLAAVVARGIRGDTGDVDQAEVFRRALRDLEPHDVRALMAVGQLDSGVEGSGRNTSTEAEADHSSTPTIENVARLLDVDLYSAWEIIGPLGAGGTADRPYITFAGDRAGQMAVAKQYDFEATKTFRLALTVRGLWLLKGLHEGQG